MKNRKSLEVEEKNHARYCNMSLLSRRTTTNDLIAHCHATRDFYFLSGQHEPIFPRGFVLLASTYAASHEPTPSCSSPLRHIVPDLLRSYAIYILFFLPASAFLIHPYIYIPSTLYPFQGSDYGSLNSLRVLQLA